MHKFRYSVPHAKAYPNLCQLIVFNLLVSQRENKIAQKVAHWISILSNCRHQDFSADKKNDTPFRVFHSCTQHDLTATEVLSKQMKKKTQLEKKSMNNGIDKWHLLNCKLLSYPEQIKFIRLIDCFWFWFMHDLCKFVQFTQFNQIKIIVINRALNSHLAVTPIIRLHSIVLCFLFCSFIQIEKKKVANMKMHAKIRYG